jgi:hypothetical protein
LCFSSFFGRSSSWQIVGVLIAKYQKGGHGDRIRQPLAGADPRAGYHTGKRIRGMRGFCGKQIGVNQLVGNEGLVKKERLRLAARTDLL